MAISVENLGDPPYAWSILDDGAHCGYVQLSGGGELPPLHWTGVLLHNNNIIVAGDLAAKVMQDVPAQAERALQAADTLVAVMRTPLTQKTLGYMHCSTPGCTDCSELWFHSRCHPGSPTYSCYSEGTMTITCAVCNEQVATLAVAE